LDSINNKIFFLLHTPQGRHAPHTQHAVPCELTTNSAALVFSQVAALAEDTSQHHQPANSAVKNGTAPRRHLPAEVRVLGRVPRCRQWVHPVFIADHNHRRGLGCSFGGLRRVETANACAAQQQQALHHVRNATRAPWRSTLGAGIKNVVSRNGNKGLQRGRKRTSFEIQAHRKVHDSYH
jgi:hypothetical protein